MQYPSIRSGSPMQSFSETSKASRGRSSRVETGSSPGDSRARIFRSLVKALGWKGADQDYGLNMRDSLASYDPNTRSLKTWMRSLFEDSNRFSDRLPMSGMMLSGRIYGPATWERPTGESESGSWPSPKTMDASDAMPHKTVVKNGRLVTISNSLNAWVRMWPTPTSCDSRGGGEHKNDAGNEQRAVEECSSDVSYAGCQGFHEQRLTGNAGDNSGRSGGIQGDDIPRRNQEENEILADTQSGGIMRRDRELGTAQGEVREYRRSPENGGREWWAAEPAIHSVVDGLPAGMDRYEGRVCIKSFQRANQLKCLGNAIVPQIAMMIWQRIKECEDEDCL